MPSPKSKPTREWLIENKFEPLAKAGFVFRRRIGHVGDESVYLSVILKGVYVVESVWLDHGNGEDIGSSLRIPLPFNIGAITTLLSAFGANLYDLPDLAPRSSPGPQLDS